LWYLPTKYVSAYYAKVPGATKGVSLGGGGQWQFPCNAKLPDIVLTIGGKKLSVPGINVNYQKSGGSNCFGGIQEAKGNMPLIAGDVFLKNLFVAFEHETGKTPRLGFAQSA
jgi:aspergillopepsin I